MNERPTPETDAEHAQFAMGGFTLDFCRKLERERDRAREDATNYYAKIGELEQERDEALASSEAFSALAWKLEKERNEAREALREWQTLRLWGAEPQHIHDFIKGQQTRIHESQDIEKTCEQLERERDEVMAKYATEATDHMLAVNKLCNERDEARERLHKVLKVLDDYEQAIKNPNNPFWDAFKKWFTSEGAK